FFKIQVLAFLLGRFSVHSFDPSKLTRLPRLMIFASVCVYGLWLYLSFSGITDVAIGIAQLLGVKLPDNFDRPFSAINIQEFWQRWHMSLMTWVREYVYVPLLGLVRMWLPGSPVAGTAITVVITFVLLGT